MLTMKPVQIRDGMMNPVFIDDGNELLLIDCGMKDSFDAICEAARAKGIDIGRLSKIIITHHDHDHIGALPYFIKACPNVQVIATEIEKEYIEDKKTPVRLIQAEENLKTATDENRETIVSRIEMLKSLEPGRVDITAKDGDVFDWCGGVQIIGTPGHLPGHIAVYIKELKTLVTGDCLNLSGGMLKSANPVFTLDMQLAKKSVEKLLGLDLVQIICYHGGIFTGNTKSALEAVIASWPE